jgi:transcriptional antiterminator RfaH
MALLNFKKQNFESYYPKYKKITKHARKVRTVIKPLFPGYLFVSLDVEKQSWSKINSTFGVKKIITMGSKPVSFSEKIIQDLKSREDINGITDIITDVPYEKGDKILINDGPLQGKVGVFDGLSDDKRIKVLFEILGRNVALSVSAMSVSR